MDYEKIYNRLCSSRKNRGVKREGGYEIHHILPKSMGGSDDENNLVKLTYREHFIAHRLLFKITKGLDKRKMYHTIRMMTGYKRYVNGKSYETLKKSLSCFEQNLPEGVYFINPSVLPFNSLEELLGRLVDQGLLFFTIPRSRKFYNNGEFNTINKYLNSLIKGGSVEKYGKWGSYDLYQIKENTFTTVKDKYTKTSLLYTNSVFGHSECHKYLCWFENTGFKNPPKNEKSSLNTKILEKFSGSREFNSQVPYHYVADGSFKHENRDTIVKEYFIHKGLKRKRRQEDALDFLVDTYNALIRYKKVAIPHAQEGNLCFDKKLRNKILDFLCKNLKATYFKSVKLIGGGMSIPVIIMEE